MAQWEMCCVTRVGWHTRYGNTWDYKIILYYFTPTGVTTRFPSIDSWGQVFAILSAAEWEAITIQHGLDIADTAVPRGISGRVRGMYINHPSGDEKWVYDDCSMMAYFKRPIQAGHNIDDAL